jgi:addiction module HigA family antidote
VGKTYPFDPDWCVTPGQVLLSWMISELADKSSVGRSKLEDIIWKNERLTEEDAAGLEKAFGVEKSFWLNLQKNYDDWLDKAVETILNRKGNK